MNEKHLEESQLVALVAAGNESALGELYDRFGRLVYSMAYNILGDGPLAEEVTQDVFLRVWEKAELYQADIGRVATWLSSLSRNRAIDIYRGLKVRPEGNLIGLAVEDAVHLTGNHNVERTVDEIDQRARMHHALARLPKDQRLAVSYAFFLGYSHGEIAETLGEPLGTVKTRIRLAMKKLRELLIQEIGGGEPDEGGHLQSRFLDGQGNSTGLDRKSIHKKKSNL